MRLGTVGMCGEVTWDTEREKVLSSWRTQMNIGTRTFKTRLSIPSTHKQEHKWRKLINRGYSIWNKILVFFLSLMIIFLLKVS